MRILSDTPNVATISLSEIDPTVGFQVSVSATATSYAAGRAASPFADNGYGVLFADGTQKLLAHEPLLCAACNLTGAEFSFIVQALGFDLTTPLNLANVSAVYRNGWLAHALSMNVLRFPAPERMLRRRSVRAARPRRGARRRPPPLIRFIRIAQAMATAGLDPVQALYLIWNEDDQRALAPKRADVASLALTLRKDFAAVESRLRAQGRSRRVDRAGADGAGLWRRRPAFFFSLIAGTFRASVPYADASPSLPQNVIDASGGAAHLR